MGQVSSRVIVMVLRAEVADRREETLVMEQEKAPRVRGARWLDAGWAYGTATVTYREIDSCPRALRVT